LKTLAIAVGFAAMFDTVYFYLKCKRLRWFVAKSSRRDTFALNVEPLHRIERSQVYVVSAVCPECSRWGWRGRSCKLNPWESDHWRRWRVYISNLPWFSLGVKPKVSEIAVDRVVSP